MPWEPTSYTAFTLECTNSHQRVQLREKKKGLSQVPVINWVAWATKTAPTISDIDCGIQETNR